MRAVGLLLLLGGCSLIVSGTSSTAHDLGESTTEDLATSCGENVCSLTSPCCTGTSCLPSTSGKSCQWTGCEGNKTCTSHAECALACDLNKFCTGANGAFGCQSDCGAAASSCRSDADCCGGLHCNSAKCIEGPITDMSSGGNLNDMSHPDMTKPCVPTLINPC